VENRLIYYGGDPVGDRISRFRILAQAKVSDSDLAQIHICLSFTTDWVNQSAKAMGFQETAAQYFAQPTV